ncbi:hypothetical protein [Mesorhizobium sp. Mes31]|uniref:hypothetical protein n=1 Tax=Mesorhizobium sp. Mes31 TaxID=2926017 RepID=UPI0021194DB7|nr:hypothetical protein [Mesorhizobium sp. Mes31]
MHRLFEVRGKQGRQHRGSQIHMIRFGYAGPCRRDLNGTKPALSGPADGRHRTLWLRRSDEQEDGVERGAGLDQTGKSPALSGRPVERQGACRLPKLVFEQPVDRRKTVLQVSQIGRVESRNVGIVHGHIVPIRTEPGAWVS